MEASWQIGPQLTGIWSELPWLLIPALALAAVGRRWPPWPVERQLDTYRILGVGPILILGAAKLLDLNDLDLSGAAEGVRYLPLLNPLDISVLLFGVASAIWWFGLTEEQRAHPLGIVDAPKVSKDGRTIPAPATSTFSPYPVPMAAALVTFLWLNSALVRALHHTIGTPFRPFDILSSFPVQTAISILWGVLGFSAMVLATQRSWRIVWLSGAGLMAVLVAKLFLIDLAGSGTLARIVSFLAVGALLLATGYFSPLPPAGTEEARGT